MVTWSDKLTLNIILDYYMTASTARPQKNRPTEEHVKNRSGKRHAGNKFPAQQLEEERGSNEQQDRSKLSGLERQCTSQQKHNDHQLSCV